MGAAAGKHLISLSVSLQFIALGIIIFKLTAYKPQRNALFPLFIVLFCDTLVDRRRQALNIRGAGIICLQGKVFSYFCVEVSL